LEEETEKQILIKGEEGLHIKEVRLTAVHNVDEIEDLALPVKTNEIYNVKIEEPHIANSYDGIGRIQGFVLDVEGGGALVGQNVKVKITKVFRTYARAEVVDPLLHN